MRRLAVWGLAFGLPVAGLVLVLAAPSLDLEWEQHPAHFWLVVLTAVATFGLGFLTGEAAARRGDARILLVSLAFLCSSGFLGLHALATPGVLLEGSNAGFQIASGVGLVLASGFAAASALDLSPETAETLVRRRRAFYAALAALLAAWAVVSLATLPPLDDPITPEGSRNPLLTVAFVGVVLYGFAAFRYARLYRRRARPLVLSVAVSYVLLAEAMFAVALSRNWHVSWWEWHLLMLVAVALVAWTAWSEWQREGSTAEIWSDLYEERTLGRREELSVLFADLQGFTAYSERTPEAEVQSMLNRCLAAVTPSVQAYGGQARIIGDAVMAVFRSPGHEEAAARAGLAFQEAAGEIAQEHPEWPHWRVGINSGAAYLGLVEAYGVKAYTPTGDIVNVGARLEAQARAGEVVIGEGTRAALGARAEVEDLGEFPVKGKERPVRAFVLRGLAAGGDEGDQRLEHQKREPDA